eukprot:TRINITY_DN406_c0_g1_i2.p1 TRINITY_DN406_c0_g1~~TRINITY_DN406_c0_g1_i2.p1  ORF type:complete len:137 (+),score=30.68 TRINITY_DN406_c0_g1_i2:177-587(+)
MVSIITYCSRVLHLSTAAFLLMTAINPYLYGSISVPAHLKLVFPIVAVVNLVTGLFNSIAVKPRRMGAAANFWRFLVYGVKLVAVLACSPLLDRGVPSDLINPIRLGCVVVAMLVASYCRYYREEHSVIPDDSKKN